MPDPWVSVSSHRTTSFFSKHSKPSVFFFPVCPFICLSVCVLALRHPYMSLKVTQVRISRYHSKFFLDRKFTVRTSRRVFTFSWKYSSRSWRFQWPVSRKAVLVHAFISAVNNTNCSSYRVDYSTIIDNTLVQGDNMYLNVFNNDLIFIFHCFLAVYLPDIITYL